jgi:hypothetical protein
MSETSTPKTLSPMYRAAIYFAVARMHFYRDALKPYRPGQNLGDYAQDNDAVIQQVVKDTGDYLLYDLSSNQIGNAIQAYLAPSTYLPATHETPSNVSPGTSDLYRAGVHFAVATMHFYRGSLKQPAQPLGYYAQANDAVIQQVIKEAREYIRYELSVYDISDAISLYLAPSMPLPAPQATSHKGISPEAA